MSWKQSETKLVREFSFTDQSQLAAFFLLVARKADETDHHPDAQISHCSRLTLELRTHDLKSVSSKDFLLAAQIDDIYREFMLQ